MSFLMPLHRDIRRAAAGFFLVTFSASANAAPGDDPDTLHADTPDPVFLPLVPRFELNDPWTGLESIAPIAMANPSHTLSMGSRSPRTTPGSFSWDDSNTQIASLLRPTAALSSNPSESAEDVSSFSEPPDDRSAWARWNSSLLGVSTTIQGFSVLMLLGFTLLPPEVTGWNEPKFEGLHWNFTKGPRVDNDRFFFNYIAHPLSGSEYYIVGRNRGLSSWEGLAYSAAMSTFFEFFVESAYERAAWQDLWITPVSGMVVGELRWQAKKALEDPVTGKPVGTLKKVLYVVLDPFDPILNL